MRGLRRLGVRGLARGAQVRDALAMEPATPDLLEVFGSWEEELTAHAAEIFFTVSGSSLVTGGAALSQAKEVRAVVEALRAQGVAEQAIEVVSVRVEVQSGLLTRSSSASYELKLRCDDLAQLPSLLGVVTSAKSVSLDRVAWLFPRDAATEGRLLARAVSFALEKAQAIAGALGTPLGPVFDVSEQQNHGMHEQVAHFGAPKLMRARSEPVDLGVALQQKLSVRRDVRLRFRLTQP